MTETATASEQERRWQLFSSWAVHAADRHNNEVRSEWGTDLKPKHDRRSILCYQRVCDLLGTSTKRIPQGVLATGLTSYTQRSLAAHRGPWEVWLEELCGAAIAAGEWTALLVEQCACNIGRGVGEAFYLSVDSGCLSSEWIAASPSSEPLLVLIHMATLLAEQSGLDVATVWQWLVASELAYWSLVAGPIRTAVEKEVIEAAAFSGKRQGELRVAAALAAVHDVTAPHESAEAEHQLKAAILAAVSNLERDLLLPEDGTGQTVAHALLVEPIAYAIRAYASDLVTDVLPEAPLIQSTIDAIIESRPMSSSALLEVSGIKYDTAIRGIAKSFVAELLKLRGRRILRTILASEEVIPYYDELSEPEQWLRRVGL